MTEQTIQRFLQEKSAINKSAFCAEAGITPQYLNMILRKERPLTDDTANKLKPVMAKYGGLKNDY